MRGAEGGAGAGTAATGGDAGVDPARLLAGSGARRLRSCGGRSSSPRVSGGDELAGGTGAGIGTSALAVARGVTEAVGACTATGAEGAGVLSAEAPEGTCGQARSVRH